MRRPTILLLAVLTVLAPVTQAASPASVPAPEAPGAPCVAEAGAVACAPAPDGPAPAAAGPGTPSEDGFPEIADGAPKVGFRAFVAWESQELAKATLTFRVREAGGDWGPWIEASELTPRKRHVLVLRNLPVGGTLEYQAAHDPVGPDADPVRSAVRQVDLANAYKDHDGEAYTVDMVVLANEVPAVARDEVRQGVDLFAELLWDSTDGHVRAGDVLLLFGDLEAQHGGFHTCSTAAVPTAACSWVPDAVFTFDQDPRVAGSVYPGAIRDAHYPIWMNALYEGTLFGADEIGAVLVHEFGHYGFWMDDLYTGNGCGGGRSPHDISIMGSARGRTEFDGPNATCPNKGGYTTSWTYLRNHYPAVGPREHGPDPGPAGDGGAYDLTSLSLLPGESLVDSPATVRLADGAHCAREVCAAASAAGPAHGTTAAASGAGAARGTVAASGLGLAEGTAAASGAGEARGTVAVAGTGTATGPVAAGAGDCRSSPQQDPIPCLAASRDGARGHVLATSAGGDASCRGQACAAATADGHADGSVALAGDGSARGTAAVAGTGPAEGLVAASGADEARGIVAASAAGEAHGDVAAVNGIGPAEGLVAASGTGDADGTLLAVSGTGDAYGFVAVSGAGHAEGDTAVGGCDAAETAGRPCHTEPVTPVPGLP